MKLFITSIVAAVTLSMLTTGQLYAQQPLEIRRIDCVQGNKSESDVRVFVKNNSRETLDLATYSLTGKTKGAPFDIRITTVGPLTISPGSTQIIDGTFARTSDETYIEFKVTGVERNSGTRHTNSRQIKVAGARIDWVVKYGTEGSWVLARVFRGDFLDTQVNRNATKLSNSLRSEFGFRIKRETKTNTGVFGIGAYHQESVYVQTTKLLERTFADQQAARTFLDSLRKQLPSVPASLVDHVSQVGTPSAELSSKRLDLIRRRALGGGK
jgi:hypothetical protein